VGLFHKQLRILAARVVYRRMLQVCLVWCGAHRISICILCDSVQHVCLLATAKGQCRYTLHRVRFVF